MGVRHFTFDRSKIESFIQFGYDLNRDDPLWIPPLRRDLYAQLFPTFEFYQEPRNSHRHFLAVSGGRVVGRASAMVNHKLKDADGTPVGTVGFFECVNDFNVTQDLLDSATHWLAEDCGIHRIWGPMNFDIWHGYRFMTHGFGRAPFYGEPYNKPYYAEFFERYGFIGKQHWDSTEINGKDALDAAIVAKRKYYESFIDQGYRFEDFEMRRFSEEIEKLWILIRQSFSGFLGFTDISLEEFRRLFTAARYAFHPRLFTFVHDENKELVGFAGAFIDLAQAVQAMDGKANLISKVRFLRHRNHANRINFYLGGMIPTGARRRAGLGRAGFCHVIERIREEAYESVVVALMARANNVQGLIKNKDTDGCREYTLYELRR